jgi:crossover junction endodeoxyribonuclease RuvC
VVVLGIDPGSRRCGYGIVTRSGARLSRLDSGVFVPGPLPTAERLGRLLVCLTELLERREVDAVAIETAFCGRSPRSALALGQARGVALAAAARAGLPVFEYAPAEVKRSFTGNGRAEKSQIMRTVRSLFGLEPRLADEADALAIAACHLACRPGRLARAIRLDERARSAGTRAQGGVLRRAVRSFRELP